ncbi:hypothetical protein ILUMI_25152 [Ignelater luminosus]|uniref:SPIN-DOC-like zinc-finger domain-containing protein n=1 Tax=Ignelater luminosus TaxID=2038154 RepID=A0A8K0C5X6_IGNLU|nr:hypothetical protein ILUMI_25152 [Ignelater luminosus]
MEVARQRKVRKFKEEWTRKFLFKQVQNKAVCLVCNTTFEVLTKFNLKRHFENKHRDYVAVSSEELKKLSEKLQKEWLQRQSTIAPPRNTHIAPTKTCYLIAYKIAKECRPLVDGEFVKECMLEASHLLCPDQKQLFENINLTKDTLVCQINYISDNLFNQLNLKADNFKFCALALELDELSCNSISDISQLSIFIRGINDDFEIMEELLALYPLRGATGEDLFLAVQECMAKVNISWNKIVSITTDGCSSLTDKSGELLKRINNQVEDKIILLHCMRHQEELCNRVLKFDHVVTVVTKIVNFIREHALTHRPFISFIKEIECEHFDPDVRQEPVS